MTELSRSSSDKLKPTSISYVPMTTVQEAGYAGPMEVAPPASCKAETPLMPAIRVLRLPEVIKRVGLCRASIYQRMPQGTFPKSVSLGPRAVGWLESEIDVWLTMRIQARR